LKKLREGVVKMTIALTILGLILSTMHQSSLGALFLIAPGKLHPLWYSPFIPVFFFVSAVIVGLSMVIFESMLSHRVFSSQIEHHDNNPLTPHNPLPPLVRGTKGDKNFDKLTIGLGKASSVILLSYFGLKWLGVIHGNHWDLLNTNIGYWFLVEVFGFVLLPAFLYAWGVREENATIVRLTAILTVIGVILNRINVSIIAFNWNAEVRYSPRWMEFAVTVTIITFGLLMFRWIANRMPILYEHADYKDAH
jgi:Ni/Fe-hydrogenase subunit HybB-like protein